MSISKKIISTAKILASKGISSIPFVLEFDEQKGKMNKRPAIKDVQTFQERVPTDSEIEKMYQNSKGIGICTGRLTGSNYSITVIDFDTQKNVNKYLDYIDIEDVKEILEKYKIPINTTVSHGYHLFFQSTNDIPCRKLARDKEGHTLIETKGTGGKITIPPTEGYTREKNNFSIIPVIDPEDAEILLIAAQSFNEYETEDNTNYSDFENEGQFSGQRPGDLYNQSTQAISDIREILTGLGWTEVNSKRGYWRRPGKSKGISAILNKSGIFVNYSGESIDFDSEGGYTAFRILTEKRFHGNYNESAKYLYSIGFRDETLTRSRTVSKINKLALHALQQGEKLSDQFQKIKELSEQNDIEETKVKHIFNDIYKKNKELFNINNAPPVQKTLFFLRNKYGDRLRFNIVKNSPELKVGADWGDMDSDTIWIKLREKYGNKAQKDIFKSFLNSKSDEYIYQHDPFVEYFNSLKGEENGQFNRFCDCIQLENTDENYNIWFRNMLLKHLIRTMKCATQKDYVNRYVFGFVGGQEIGKSSIIRYLVPFEGKEYYTDEFIDLKSKDFIVSLSKNFIYNIEEFEGLSDGDMAKMKTAVSKMITNVREAYRENAKVAPKRASFFLNTNKKELFNDAENTRFLMFDLKKIDFKYSNIKVDDIWSEVKYFSSKINCELTGDEKDNQRLANDNFMNIDIVDSFILRMFSNQVPIESRYFMSWDEVYTKLTSRITLYRDIRDLGKRFDKLRFTKGREKGYRGVYLKEKDFNKI